jgi:type IV secretion system protein VirB10
MAPGSPGGAPEDLEALLNEADQAEHELLTRGRTKRHLDRWVVGLLIVAIGVLGGYWMLRNPGAIVTPEQAESQAAKAKAVAGAIKPKDATDLVAQMNAQAESKQREEQERARQEAELAAAKAGELAPANAPVPSAPVPMPFTPGSPEAAASAGQDGSTANAVIAERASPIFPSVESGELGRAPRARQAPEAGAPSMRDQLARSAPDAEGPRRVADMQERLRALQAAGPAMGAPGTGGASAASSAPNLSSVIAQAAGAQPFNAGGSGNALRDALASPGATTPRAPSAQEATDAMERSMRAERGDILRPLPAIGPQTVHKGTMIDTTLITGIQTGLTGELAAIVAHDVRDTVNGASICIARGTKLVGRYLSEARVGQSRIFAAFNEMILPDGRRMELGSMRAADGLGKGGLPADVNNHFFRIFGTAFVIGAASRLMSNRPVTISSGLGGSSTVTDAATIALTEAVRVSLERNRFIQPTLSVEPGTPFVLAVNQHMDFSSLGGCSRD